MSPAKNPAAAFFDRAILDRDGVRVETTGQCMRGLDIASNRPLTQGGRAG